MKLLIITQTVNTEDPVLGFFHAWITQFAKLCDQVTVICLKEGKHDVPANVRVLSLGKETAAPHSHSDTHTHTRYSYLIQRLSYLLKFYSYVWLNRNEYDAVFVHMNPEYVVLGAPVWRLWGKRVTLWYTHKSVTVSLRIAARLAHLIFTASKESFRLPSNNVRVVGHGIDTTRFAPDPQSHEGFVVGTIGRITKSKQLECIVDATASLAAYVPHTKVRIAGAPATDGDRAYETSICEHANKVLGTRAEFVGPLSHADVPVFLNSLDVFVNMSQTGSLDKAILEAMACGVPCITTNDAGREVVRVVSPELVQTKDVAELLRIVTSWSAEERAAYRTAATAYVTAQHSLPALITRIIGTMSR